MQATQRKSNMQTLSMNSVIMPAQNKSERSVYSFGASIADGNKSMKKILGGKGANLAEMTLLGLPVPPGFTISTTVCIRYLNAGGDFSSNLYEEVDKALSTLENRTGRLLGDVSRPLLLSVRSGAVISMPGMMDTVLNLGLNDDTVEALASISQSPRFAYDSYRRFIQMFGNVVLGIDISKFETILKKHKKNNNVTNDGDLSTAQLQDIIKDYKDVVRKMTGSEFEQNPRAQLWQAIAAVFLSWKNVRAVTYRKIQGIPDDVGTAVTVQAMVFGNSGKSSGTGVAFTRDPSTGADELYGEFLVNAQGEDVVAGIRTPQPISIAAKERSKSECPAMEEVMPEPFNKLMEVRQILESHFCDVQDIEFTIENGTFYLLQTRSAKRSARAAVKIAVDLVRAGLITKEEALVRVDPESITQLLHPTLDPQSGESPVTTGLPASPGAASGRVAMNCAAAENMKEQGDSVILVRDDTSPEDVRGMHASAGILTARGGMTSHAAVVARGMGRPCVTGASSISVDEVARTVQFGDSVVREGDFLTIDGGTGGIYVGKVPTKPASLENELQTLLEWADSVRTLKVMANAETPKDVSKAVELGAEGVGLCRTEHMFFDEKRISTMRQMILAEDETNRRLALEKLLPMQRGDFVEIFNIVDGRPVTVRLLDPPLHEFLPHKAHEVEELAKIMGKTVEETKQRAEKMREVNPMLGLRGCRVGILYPEIYEMQIRAAFQAASIVAKTKKSEIRVDIMVPFVSMESELKFVNGLVDKVAMEELQTRGNSYSKNVKYTIGAMIELPRAVLHAGSIAKHAKFFSFGTNDLTQTTMGLSRDDAGSVISLYMKKGLINKDPFVSLDNEGVGELLRLGVERGRSTRENLKVSLCGEQGGDPSTVKFCHQSHVDAVSCSPYQIPISRLAAARAALNH